MATQDVIVIGAGAAGLTAAAVAAKAGARVTLLERKPVTGGRATTDVIDGFHCNQGAHALYAGGAGVDVLARLGIEPKGAKPPLDGQGRRGEILGALPAGPAALATTALLRPASRARMAKAFVKVQTTKAQKVDHTTWKAWVDDLTGDEAVREIFHALARLSTYANAPDLVSAGAVLAQLQSANDGVWYLDGGWQQLVDGLVGACAASGVTIETGVEVSEVRPTDGGWEVVAGDALRSAASVILAGLAPAVCARLLHLATDAFAAAGPAAEAAVLDLRLDEQPEHRFVLGLDQPTYFSVHGPPASMAPEGKAAAVAMKYLPVAEKTTVEQDRADLEGVATAAGATAVLGDRFLRRMTVTHGIPLASQGGLAGRPGVAVDRRPGVYLAGDWVGETGLLVDAAFASGEAAGRMAAERAGADRPKVGASS